MEIKGTEESLRPPSKGEGRKNFCRPEDVSGLQYRKDVGHPGEFPFTRGIHPEMYRGRLWTMRQYAGYGTARESNRRFRYLLDQGTTGLSVAFDLPTQIGLDSDHGLATGEVGRAGVAIDSLADMEELLEGVPLTRVSTSMTINATAAVLLASYLAVATAQKADWRKLRGTIQNDILKEYLARGTYVYPPEASLRIVTDILSFCHREVPSWNPISISGYHIREAGSTAAQELGFTLANAETYVLAAAVAGLSVDDFAPRLSFFFSAHNDFFEEVAKFRAARRMWSRLMRYHLGAKDERSWKMRLHAQTAGSTLTAQQPENNAVRVTLQALAAVLGGAQSLHTNSRDEALALPTREAARLALRTQQILAHESGVTAAADPLGGSWYVEKLTRDLEEEATAYLERIRSLGGMLPALQSGYVQKEIQQAAYADQRSLESGDSVLVGVNRFGNGESPPIETLRIDRKPEERQVQRLQERKAAREFAQVERELDRIRLAAAGDENLMPAIVSAVTRQATVGEIASAMKDVFGEHQEHVVV